MIYLNKCTLFFIYFIFCSGFISLLISNNALENLMHKILKMSRWINVVMGINKIQYTTYLHCAVIYINLLFISIKKSTTYCNCAVAYF